MTERKIDYKKKDIYIERKRKYKEREKRKKDRL